jgi:hypothetical protein
MKRAGHYEYSDYLAMVSTSREPHLLVEGKGDLRFFKLLFDQFQLKDIVHLYAVEDIDCFPNINGNRGHVEHLCRQNFENLFGFVDREFRKFQISKRISDEINGHNIDGNILWSRGHSIENYCFSFDILRSPFRGQTSIKNFSLAIDLFCENFLNILNIACVFSLIAKNLNIISGVNNIIFDALTFENDEIGLNFEKLFSLINERCSNVTKNKFDAISNAAKDLVIKTCSETVRWYIHGHIGFKTIISSFQYLLVEIVRNEKNETGYDERKKANHFRRIDDEQHFFNCLEEWVKHPQSRELTDEIMKLCGIIN